MGLDPRVLAAMPPQVRDGQIVIAAYAGSTVHGTSIKPETGGIDDLDILGAVMPSVDTLLGLDRWEHWVEFIDEIDITLYSLQKLVRLWEKGNPNVLGLLWTPWAHIPASSETYFHFRNHRDVFASKRVLDAFGGYAIAQISKMEKGAYRGYMGARRKEMVQKFGYDVKNASHAIRLLRMAVEFAQDGELHVDRSKRDAHELRAIKRGEWSFDRVQLECTQLKLILEEARLLSSLPERPDHAAINSMLVEVTANWIRTGKM